MVMALGAEIVGLARRVRRLGLPRLAAASGVGWRLEVGRIPRRAGATAAQALGEGEDYELLAAFPAECWEELEEAWRRRFPRLGLRRIGTLAERGVAEPVLAGGWDHFGGGR